MLRPLLEFLLLHYSVSPAVFWTAFSLVTLLAGGGLMILGLCHMSGEADDRADHMLAQLQGRHAP